MATKKQEQQINVLNQKILELKENLNGSQIHFLNITSTFYSFGRLNILQATARLTQIALDLNLSINDITDLLGD